MNDAEVRSPCVSICVLNDDDVCVGCYRTGQEITDWFMSDNDQRRAILAKSLQRREQAGGIF